MSLDAEAIEFWLKWSASAALGIALLFALFFAMVRTFARPQAPLDPARLVGVEGTAVSPISRREGRVRIDGHLIRAIADEEIAAGGVVKVLEVDGLIAKVGPVR